MTVLSNMSLNDTNKTDDSMNWSHFSLLSFTFFGLIAVTGAFGNLLSFLIFIRPRFRSASINIFLAFMSVADFILLTLCFPVYALGPLVGILGPPSMYLEIPYAFSVCYLYPIATMFHCSSVWLLVAVTVEQWLAVCRPFTAQLQHLNRAICLSSAIICSSFLLNFIRFWEFSISSDGRHFQPVLHLNKVYMVWYYNGTTLLSLYMIPLATVLYFNYNIAKELKRSDRRRHNLTTNQMENRQTTIMVVFIVTYFIISYTPALCLNILEVIDPDIFQSDWGFLISDFNNLIVLAHAASSFLFYLKFSSRYRLEFQLILSKLCCRPSFRYRLHSKNAENVRLYSIVNTSPSVTRRRKITRMASSSSTVDDQSQSSKLTYRRSDSRRKQERRRDVRRKHKSISGIDSKARHQFSIFFGDKKRSTAPNIFFEESDSGVKSVSDRETL